MAYYIDLFSSRLMKLLLNQIEIYLDLVWAKNATSRIKVGDKINLLHG